MVRIYHYLISKKFKPYANFVGYIANINAEKYAYSVEKDWDSQQLYISGFVVVDVRLLIALIPSDCL